MPDFFWGVATSAYQSEGGYNGPGQPQTNWAEVERHGDVANVGLAADFWNRYPEDFARCRELGLSAFRLGLEWSRIQPTHIDRMGRPPPFDAKALDHYVSMLADCRQNGLEPIVTLHHFVHPAWLGADPWLDPATAELFANYVEHALLHVNRGLIDRHGLSPIRYYITINEPNMLVLNTYLGTQFPGRKRGLNGLRTLADAYRNILCAHLRVYNLIHRLAEEQRWPEPRVTFNNYCSDLYWSDKVLLDLLSVRERGVKASELRDYVYLKIQEFEAAFQEAAIPLQRDLPSRVGSLVKRLSNFLGYKTFMPEHFRPLIDELYAANRPIAFALRVDFGPSKTDC